MFEALYNGKICSKLIEIGKSSMTRLAALYNDEIWSKLIELWKYTWQGLQHCTMAKLGLNWLKFENQAKCISSMKKWLTPIIHMSWKSFLVRKNDVSNDDLSSWIVSNQVGKGFNVAMILLRKIFGTQSQKFFEDLLGDLVLHEDVSLTKN